MGVPAVYPPLIRAAGQRWGVPPAVLGALIDQESGYDASSVSSAGAFGSTQFMPGTAESYGVQRGTSPRAIRTQIFGAAKYLHDLGYSKKPRFALAAYNGGPGNPQYGYADEVLGKAGEYASLNRPGPTAPGAAGVAGAGAPAVASATVTPGQVQTADLGPLFDLASAMRKQHTQSQVQVSAPPAPSFAARLPFKNLSAQLPSMPPAGRGGLDIEGLLAEAARNRPEVAATPQTATAVGPGGPVAHGSLHAAYRFPLPNVASIGRTDRGQDMEAAKPYSKTVAVGDGVIVRAGIGFPGIVLKLDRPFAGHRLVFYGHNHATYVKPGQRVRAGQVVGETGQPANGSGGPTHTEIGFTNSPDAIPSPQGPGHWAPTGQAFHNLLTKLRPDLYR